MIETLLASKLKKIFDFDKVTFDHPGESEEQECLFVNISTCKDRLKDGLETARVQGVVTVFCNSQKLPYGYFSKKISAADKADKADLFFFDFEENAGTFRNISKRSLGFVFFYNSQYDPDIGTLNLVELETTYGS